jgi:hypothetical protein
MAAELKPDVVLIDLHMRDEREFDPASTKSHLLGCAKRILAMSVWVDGVSRALATDYGAVKLFDKSCLASELIPAIIQVSDPGRPVPVCAGNQSGGKERPKWMSRIWTKTAEVLSR